MVNSLKAYMFKTEARVILVRTVVKAGSYYLIQVPKRLGREWHKRKVLVILEPLTEKDEKVRKQE